MALSRLRWALGGAIALLSLVVAVRALGAYVEHRLWLGSASVLLLAAIAIGGLYSLGQARLRIERVLSELADKTIGAGGWLAARRAQLERVRDHGAALDLDAIAAATAAEERGRAYLGRYLVAVTVLVGLVGTFAGLMETLREVAPLLRDDRLSTAQALAAPLAGLDVTFGASVVGILVTLALALVQGDLVLAEEQALARLEERTAHELVPALWPPAAHADERLIAEVSALRRDVQASLATVGEATATRVAAATRDQIEQLVAATRTMIERAGETLQASTKQHAEALQAATAAVTDSLRVTAEAAQATLRSAEASARGSTNAAAEVMRATAQTADATLREAIRAAADALHGSTKEHAQALQSAAETTNDTLRAAAAATTEALRNSAEATEATLRSSAAVAEATLRGAADAASAAVSAASSAAVEAARESSQSVGVALRESTELAAQSLADAAGGLRESSVTLSASLATLAPELAALAREVALLAARPEHDDADPAIADELVRLGDGVERLEQLLERERGRRDRA